MTHDVYYDRNAATEHQVAEHLLRCDASFIPRLSARTDVPEYARKIVASAERFEAWAAGRLVGLVAAYCNDVTNGVAFITSVSVLPEWTGRGVGRRLVDECIAHARELGLTQVRLEVAADNVPAIRLYEGRDFGISDIAGSTWTMTRALTTTDGANE